MSLPQRQAAGLLCKLEPRQMQLVATEIANSDPLRTDEQQYVLREFAHRSIPAPHFKLPRKADTSNLLKLLVDEHPQTIALVVSNLPTAAATEILARLPAELRSTVVRRIATLGPTDPEVVREVELWLERRTSRPAGRS